MSIIATATTEYRDLPLAVLTESRTNPRRIFEDNALKELADFVTGHIMQSVFSVAARGKGALEDVDFDARAGALKTDWTEPLQDAGAMGIEWLAES